jgi:2-keto-3-deoxy-L-rhamnonate aldolase RhmA
MPSLTLATALQEGRTAYGTFTMLKGGRVAQVVAHTGLDAVVVDCEHGEWGGLVLLLRSLEPRPRGSYRNRRHCSCS